MSTPIARHSCCARHELLFRSPLDDFRAYSFPCDECGTVDLDTLSEQARNDYLYARAFVGRRYCAPTIRPVGPG